MSGPGASLTRVALNARGDAAAVWRNGRLIVAAVRHGPAGPWRPGRVAEAVAPVQDLAVALDRRGRATAAWIERLGEGFQVRLATADAAGSEWSVRGARLSTPGPEPPSLALSPGRGALAAWVDDGRVLTSRTVAGAFERPVEMSDADGASAGRRPRGIGLGPGVVERPPARRHPGAPGRRPAGRRAPVGRARGRGHRRRAGGGGQRGRGRGGRLGHGDGRGGPVRRGEHAPAGRALEGVDRGRAAPMRVRAERLGRGRRRRSVRRWSRGAGTTATRTTGAPRPRWPRTATAGRRPRSRAAGLAGPPAVATAPTEGIGVAWSVAGPGGGVRAAQTPLGLCGGWIPPPGLLRYPPTWPRPPRDRTPSPGRSP